MKPSILVTGASRASYGEGIAVGLGSDYDVWTMQRNPCMPLPSDRWLSSDLNEPQQTVMALQQLDAVIGPLQEKPALQAVVHAAAVQEKTDYETLTTFDVTRAFAVNIVEPLMLTKHLLDYGLLEWTGHVIFLLDCRSFSPELAIFGACKKALPLFVEAMAEQWAATLQIRFLTPNPKSRQGAIKHTSSTVQKMLSDDSVETYVDLTR